MTGGEPKTGDRLTLATTGLNGEADWKEDPALIAESHEKTSEVKAVLVNEV